jgi:hypothetical protein
MWKNVLGVAVGLVIGLIMLLLVEYAAQLLFPPDGGLDLDDPAVLKELHENQPIPKLLVMVAAWALGATVGGWICCELGGTRRVQAALVVGLLLQLISIRLFTTLRHPAWMVVATQLVILPAAYGGTRLTLLIENWHRRRS